MAKSTHAIILIVVLFAALGIHTAIMIAAGSTAALGIHAIILTVGLLAAYVGYHTGKRVGHRRGMIDGKMQQVLAQRQTGEMTEMHDDQGIQKGGQESG